MATRRPSPQHERFGAAAGRGGGQYVAGISPGPPPFHTFFGVFLFSPPPAPPAPPPCARETERG